MEQFKPLQIGFPLRRVLFVSRFYSLGHKIIGQDLTQVLGMFFLVENPPDQLIIIGFGFDGKQLNLLHGLLYGLDMLCNQIKAGQVIIDPAGNLAV
jgi:hypothetical protein